MNTTENLQRTFAMPCRNIALKDGDYLRESNETDRIDDKTVFTVKGT